MQNYTVLDAETLTHNKGHKFDPRNKLISYAYTSPTGVCFRYYTDPNFSAVLEHVRASDVLVGFNFKFDHLWCNHLYSSDVKIWCCQLAEFVYTGQTTPYASLNECLEKYGLETKHDQVKELWDAGFQTDEIPVTILEEYNRWDVIQTEKLYLIQQQLLSDEQKNLVLLLGEDLKVLAHMEQAGMLFDPVGAREKLVSVSAEVDKITEELNTYLPEIKHGTFNWGSGDHLSAFLYGATIVFDYAIEEEATYKSGVKKGEAYKRNRWFSETVVFPRRFQPLDKSEVKKTRESGPDDNHFYQTDEPTIKQLSARRKEDKRIIELLVQRGNVGKVAEMIQSVFDKFEEKQWQDNLIHSNYNQNVVSTGRLSSSQINMQNQPPELDLYLVSRYD